ncbi:hypothetical protein LC593_02215 [Nostoc sp. CHAB 5844]|nr:hypothetical protein [Nostoc sp. CHAB 5844]
MLTLLNALDIFSPIARSLPKSSLNELSPEVTRPAAFDLTKPQLILVVTQKMPSATLL